jgi:periplasmic protein TonB
MNATALPFGATRDDALRWGLCFVVVIAAHAAVAMSFLLKPSSDDDFGVDAPVVMLELPESFVVSTAPPTDLAPGPMQEENDATPPPKEETRPPEQQAEIALPEPQPPKPEPPQEQRQAMAPPAAAPSVAVLHRWETELVAHIERFKRYPSTARARGDRGVARVAFTIDGDGRVRGSRIVQSSGSPELDQEALTMLTRAEPLPRPPGRTLTDQKSFTIPVRFDIR